MRDDELQDIRKRAQNIFPGPVVPWYYVGPVLSDVNTLLAEIDRLRAPRCVLVVLRCLNCGEINEVDWMVHPPHSSKE